MLSAATAAVEVSAAPAAVEAFVAAVAAGGVVAAATLCRGTLLGPPPTGHVPRVIDSGVFVVPVGGPSRSLFEVRGAPWVALPAKRCVSVGLLHPFWCLAGGTTALFHVFFS